MKVDDIDFVIVVDNECPLIGNISLVDVSQVREISDAEELIKDDVVEIFEQPDLYLALLGTLEVIDGDEILLVAADEQSI